MAIVSKTMSTFTFGTLVLVTLFSTRWRRGRFYFNCAIYVGGMGICSVWGILVSLVLWLVPSQRFNINMVVARSFWLLVSPLVGVRFLVEGEEFLDCVRPAVVVGNHQSLLDILYLGRIFPAFTSIMAKRELKFMPLLGQFMALSGAVFINRTNLKDSIKAFQQVGDTMNHKNLSLWIFPEGTRSGLATPDLLAFKKGAFHLAIQAGVPVIPVVCENYNRLFDGSSRFESGSIRIRVLPPVSTNGLTAQHAGKLADEVRQMMLDELRRMDEVRQTEDVHPGEVSRYDSQLHGVAGFFARLVGVGTHSSTRLHPNVEQREKELRKQGTTGESPQDYNLVSEAQKPPPL